MGFNHIKTKGQDFESFKAELEDAIEILEELCDKVEEMEEQFGERDGGNMGGNRGGGRSGNRGGYGERDDYMRYDGVDYGERRGRRNR
jgi:hypothetical protein